MIARVALDRYNDELRQMPASGGGGCHSALLRVANFGRLAGVNPNQIAQDLAANVHGARKVSRGEIIATVNKAFNPFSTFTPHATMCPAVDGGKLLNAIVDRGAAFGEAELWEASPVRVDWSPEDDATEVLRRLYRPQDRLFIGMRFEAGAEHVLPVSEWISRFERGIAIPEHIGPNPLSGEQGQTKDGKQSYRADACVARFRFAVVEFDTMPRERQFQFWAGVKLPVVALLDSGGKSVHGWVRIDAADADGWTLRVENKLFSLLSAIGADASCRNESRLSRMPGHYRTEKGHFQRLLYLDPFGGPVNP
jgi:hypothetical protein